MAFPNVSGRFPFPKRFRQIDGTTDLKARPASRSSTGRWRACYFMLGEYHKTFTHICAMSDLLSGEQSQLQVHNMPALETLYLRDFRLGDAGFIVSAPNILDLTITRTSRRKIRFSRKVNLSLSSNIQKRERHVASLLDLLERVSGTKTLILDTNIVEMLSSCMDELSQKPCPFNNLEFLKINIGTWKGKDNIPSMPSQVPQKRSRQQLPEDTMANKVHKLFADNDQPATMVLKENNNNQDKLVNEDFDIQVVEKLTPIKGWILPPPSSIHNCKQLQH
ncbi:F-box domain, cyclin-like protein [Artemisia annua]|uniref:F-box domain, cyclin-like protein n=1 Tax=Artemisia annua TaxID=35608 RepID=A0A2U1MCI8_ARTAN|nr:F-box domain, cyclin-like protein [Artemisia annua]